MKTPFTELNLSSFEDVQVEYHVAESAESQQPFSCTEDTYSEPMARHFYEVN
jgi:hypothetical protein